MQERTFHWSDLEDKAGFDKLIDLLYLISSLEVIPNGSWSFGVHKDRGQLVGLTITLDFGKT